MTIDRFIAIISLILVVCYLPPVRDWGVRSKKKVLDEISAPDYIHKQKALRTTNLIRGLGFMAFYLVLDVSRFMSSVPKVDPQPLALATLSQLLCGFLALRMFASALVNDQRSKPDNIEKRRIGLMKDLGISPDQISATKTQGLSQSETE